LSLYQESMLNSPMIVPKNEAATRSCTKIPRCSCGQGTAASETSSRHIRCKELICEQCRGPYDGAPVSYATVLLRP
jgi:hypothetical protein